MSNRIVTIVLGVAALFAAIALVPRLRAMRLPGDNSGFEPAQPVAFSHRLHAGELAISCHYCHSGAERSRHAGFPAASSCMNCHRFVSAKRADVRAEEELAKKEGRKPRQVVSPEIRKIYDSLGLDAFGRARSPRAPDHGAPGPAPPPPHGGRRPPPRARPPAPGRPRPAGGGGGGAGPRARAAPYQGTPYPDARPIQWARIHQLPDFAYFDHRPHVAAGLECQKCHGAVETMERVRQVSTLNMGWCVNCHRGRDGTVVKGKAVKASSDCSACHV